MKPNMTEKRIGLVMARIGACVAGVALVAMMIGCSNKQEKKGDTMKTSGQSSNATEQKHELNLTDANFIEETKIGVILVDFWAPWCGPCKMQGPIVEKVAAAMVGQAKVGKCNVDEAPESSGRFGIRSIPTIIVLKDGKEVDRFVGVQQESALVSAITKHIR